MRPAFLRKYALIAIFDILDYRKKSGFLPKLLRMCKICSTFAADLVKINACTRKNFQQH